MSQAHEPSKASSVPMNADPAIPLPTRSLLDRGDPILSPDEVARLVRPAPPTALAQHVAHDVLALADDEFLMGHRHSEWLGLAPFLEEDLTMASIAQEELGHARLLYGVLWPEWAERDDDIARRPAHEWRSGALTELDSEPWELHFVRHLFYDTAEPIRWNALREHMNTEFGRLVDRVLAEERFHQRHATALVERLGRASSEARTRLQHQIEALWPTTATLFVGRDAEEQRNEWHSHLATIVAAADLRLPPPVAVDVRRSRTAGFARVHATLLAVIATDPSARW